MVQARDRDEDTAMDLADAQARIADLEEKLGACNANGEGGDELEELISFIPEDDGGDVGVASSGCNRNPTAGVGGQRQEVCRYNTCVYTYDCFRCKCNYVNVSSYISYQLSH